jgi:hypothetical protein
VVGDPGRGHVRTSCDVLIVRVKAGTVIVILLVVTIFPMVR